MKCDICGSTDTYIKQYFHSYIIKGKKIEFIADRRFCKNCDSLVYDHELDNAVSEIAIAKFNEQYGILGADITKLRNKFNLSQDIFSRIIGCAKKTLISYEKGKSIPNDSYLIILKSLLAKPETIFTLIEVNKGEFTDKELEKINSRIGSFEFNNADIFGYCILDDELSEYNGYTKFSKEKLFNMILFFAEKTIKKTKLLKEMFYADFLYYRDMCKSITGSKYVKLTYGPVPEQYDFILNMCTYEGLINCDVEYNNDYECINISSNKKFNANLFTEDELAIMQKVKEKFEDFGSKAIADYSHKEKGYLNTKFSDEISYDYALDIDLN